MKLKILISIIFLNALTSCKGQDENFQEKFKELCQTRDTIGQLKLLQRWEKSKPKDPELFTSLFNYYYDKSKKQAVNISTEQLKGESLSFQNKDGKTVGYISDRKPIFLDKLLEKSFEKIDKGINLYPNRLDMRFGKVYALGQLPDWERFTSEIIKAIDYSSINKNNWTWTNDEKYNGGEKEFLLDIQTYQLQIYNTGDDNLLKYMQKIAIKVLEHYPNHIESLSNLSITYLLDKKYDKAIEKLKIAEKINPKDGIILSNIAHGYRLKGDINSSIAYYEKMLKLDDNKSVEFAKQRLKEIKK